ncbi:sensor histidine kinase [Paenibacillus antarcticus]|uniref:histidine kinase n=1 Tax=Paenibacillus antarcticus TaxID=253703 RepID=A0A168KCF4_9BACL|nr:sensor histidine kinase [Paenibacillus antarcticus]OAB41830.1 hypothetical protein PBAT_20835 [Paenibacillus antarcticus]
MFSYLTILRYGFIFIASFSSIYIYRYDNYAQFIVTLLLYMFLVVLDRFIHNLSAKKLLLCIDIIFSVWLCYTYGYLMLFVSLSSLFVYVFLPHRGTRWLMLSIHLILLNASFHHEQALWIICINSTFILTAVLLSLLQYSTKSHGDLITLYDELRKEHYELDETRKRLVEFTHQVEATAQSGERERIARHLHDHIGHRLIRVKMMMEAAIQIMPSNYPRGMDLMNQIRDQLSGSMDDMRNTVNKMRPATSLTEEYAIDRLLEETGRTTGIHTNLKIRGIPIPLYPSLQIVLFKNAKEAVTNALRHGNATSVEVILTYDDGEVCMDVSNTGEISPLSSVNTRQQGMGLSGMEERVKLVGGHMRIQWEYPFTIVTTLPVYNKNEVV